MIENINVRFFSYCIADNELDIIEVTESQFKELEGVIAYHSHSVHENGARQVCLTIEPSEYPYFKYLERV
jgi:hypothetical protein